jgi:hypothetical protein
MTAKDTDAPTDFPKAFAALDWDSLIGYGDDPQERLRAAKNLGEMLLHLPELSAHLADLRRDAVRAIRLRDGMSYADQAKHYGVKPARVSAIARGAIGDRFQKAAAAAGEAQDDD